jgi:hypothetical protein
MSGFAGAFVGFHVGKFGPPDNKLVFGISEITAICRKCRVLQREESAGEIERAANPPVGRILTSQDIDTTGLD